MQGHLFASADTSFAPEEEIQGVIEYVHYRNEENGYTIARLETANQQLVTIVGNFAVIQEEQAFQVWGTWTQHPRFGQQFKVNRYEETLPMTPKGIQAYLSSGLFTGINAAMAKKLVKKFGRNTLHVLAEQPERLSEVSELSEAEIKILQESWADYQEAHQTIRFFQRYGISSATAIKVYQEWGSGTISRLQRNPYELAEQVDGIGFRKADQIALSLGFALDSPFRIESSLIYALTQAQDDGHCYLPEAELLQQAERTLRISRSRSLALQEGLTTMKTAKRLIAEDRDANSIYYLPAIYHAEVGIAKELQRLLNCPLRVDQEWLEEWLGDYQKTSDLTLSPEQIEAVRMAATHRVCILTGGPGTGKSLTSAAIYALWKAQKKTIALAAPTGRAASRLGEILAAAHLRGVTASTIHRLLEYTPIEGFQRHKDEPLEEDCILVDEASMIDVYLAYALVRAIASRSQLFIQGDVDQLSSVGPGNFLKDLIASGTVPVMRLTKVFRQAEASRIVTAAHTINWGQMPEIEPISIAPQTDCLWREAPTPEQGLESVRRLITRFLPERGYLPMLQVQLLSAQKTGIAGTHSLNRLLQELLNPPMPHKLELLRGDGVLREGDRVMQTVNNYATGVWNGDFGTILTIDHNKKLLTIAFRQQVVEYNFADLGQISLAYCLSVHKSQGSQFPVVIMMCYPNTLLMNRSLVYTGLTRAENLAIFVGEIFALKNAIQKLGNRRNTLLAERLIHTKVEKE